ncbi:MAG: hypothetical protein HY774_17585 [Acidobacteria bacterium]|nr:hypothetical protein [Acidobacteriota bacterium]
MASNRCLEMMLAILRQIPARRLLQIILVGFWVVFPGQIAWGQFVTSHDALPQPEISKPLVGVQLTDPVFGTTIQRLTDARAAGVDGIFPEYSRRQAWNADETLLLLRTGDGETLLYEGRTYQFLKRLDVGGEDVFWHPTNPLLLYYNPDNALHSYHVFTGEDVLLHTFADYDFANTRGEGNLSNDGRYYALVGQKYNQQTGEVRFQDLILFDLILSQVVKTLALPENLPDFDWVSISPGGNFIVVDYASEETGPFRGVEVYDLEFQRLWQKPLSSGHSDLGLDAAGEEVLVIGVYDPEPNRNYIKKYRLSGGQETVLLDMEWSFYNHISCRNEARFDWCLVSTYDGEGRLEDSASSWLPFEDELLLVKLDGSGEVRRLAHHHSRRFSPQTPDSDTSVYFAEPHATISRRGDRVLFGSNWRQDISQASSVDAFVVDFRSLIEPTSDFSLALNQMLITIEPGNSTQVTITTQIINNFATPIALSASIRPLESGISATFSPNPVQPGESATLTLSTTPATPEGNYVLVVTGIAAGIHHQAAAALQIGVVEDFSIGFDVSSVTVERGDVVSVTMHIQRVGGFVGAVEIKALNAKALKLKVVPKKVSTMGDEVVFRIKPKKRASLGSHPLEFEARDLFGKVRMAKLDVMVVITQAR